MAITAEDGTGLAGANSYVTLIEVDAYWSEREDTVWTDSLTDEVKTAALLDAARYLDATYRWVGQKADQDNGMDWPRNSGVDADGYSILSTVVPAKVKEAQYVLAKDGISSSAASPLLPAETRGGAIKRQMNKADVLEQETEYFSGAPSGKTFPLVDGLLHGLFRGKRGGSAVSVAKFA